MSRVYKITHKGEVIKTKSGWCHDSLGKAKLAAKSHVRYKNKYRPKGSKISFDDYKVVEYDLRIVEEHII